MRCYCKNCGTEMTFKMETVGCPYCKSIEYWVRIPDYETPEQYEKRTGKQLPDNTLMWGIAYSKYGKNFRRNGLWWRTYWWGEAKEFGIDKGTKWYFVIAGENIKEAPSDDWKPEEVENEESI